jgi:hypothetical protein
VEHGQLGIDRVREAVAPLGYVLDFSSFVNSMWVLGGP